jgi:type I site-specific restriction-modification system R (restriction) subunit
MRKRKATWSEENPDGRWRCYNIEELLKRDKLSLDLFWIKDKSLTDTDSLPAPDILAAEIADELETAFDLFSKIAKKLPQSTARTQGQVVTELSRAFALCAASDEATNIRDDVSFFQALQAALNKQSSSNGKTPEQINAAIRQLVSQAITTEGQVIDVFTACGIVQAGHQHLERSIPRRSTRTETQKRHRRSQMRVGVTKDHKSSLSFSL